MTQHDYNDVKRMIESMSVGDLHTLLDERDEYRARYEKAHADCQEMIRLHDEVEKERDELHALLKAVVDYAIDKAGLPVTAMIGPDAPLRAMRKIHEQWKTAYSELENDRNAREHALAAELAEVKRELERWKHGQQIEGDYVCPADLERDSLRALLLEACDIGERLAGLECDSAAEDRLYAIRRLAGEG